MNTKNIGYEDYRQLLYLFKDLLKEKLGDCLISLVLYGSVAQEKADKPSDIDILIIQKDAPPVYYLRLEPVLEVEREIRKSEPFKILRQQGLIPHLSYIILSLEEAEQNRFLFLDMIQNSIILIDRGDFFVCRLRELKQRLECLGARKVILSDGSWYWDLKPDLIAGEIFTL